MGVLYHGLGWVKLFSKVAIKNEILRPGFARLRMTVLNIVILSVSAAQREGSLKDHNL